MSACALVFKLSLYINLRCKGKIKKDIGCFKGFLSVLAYGGKGAHIVEEKRKWTANPIANIEAEDGVEMAPRPSVCAVLESADLKQYEKRFSMMGVVRSSDLLDVDDEDLEDLGLSRLQKKKLRRAMPGKATTKKTEA